MVPQQSWLKPKGDKIKQKGRNVGKGLIGRNNRWQKWGEE